MEEGLLGTAAGDVPVPCESRRFLVDEDGSMAAWDQSYLQLQNVLTSEPYPYSAEPPLEFGESIIHSIHRLGDYRGNNWEIAQYARNLTRLGGTAVRSLIVAYHGDHIHCVASTRSNAEERRIFERRLKFLGRPVRLRKYPKQAFSKTRQKHVWEYLRGTETGY